MKQLSWILTLLFVALAGRGTAQDMTSTTAVIVDPSTTSTSESSAQIFEVAVDGTRPYTSIENALAAATDPHREKTILLYPGDYTIPNDTQIILGVPNTHILGVSGGSVTIRGSVSLDSSPEQPLTGGLVVVNASDCSVVNVNITNAAEVHDPRNTHSTALRVGSHDGPPVERFRAHNCEFVGVTIPEVHDGWGYDVVWVLSSASDTVLSGCTVVGASDIISNWSRDLSVIDCVVDVRLGTGGYPFWTGSNARYSSINPNMSIFNTEVRGAKYPFAYLVFDRGGQVTMINVNETRDTTPQPDFFIATDGSTGTLTIQNVLGKMPANSQRVKVRRYR